MIAIKSSIRKRTPRWVLRWYHTLWSLAGNLLYGFPSKELIVIGVTGTNGKSTTANLIARVLESATEKTGLLTTVNYKIGETERLNTSRMTMLGRLQLQKMLRDMVRAGCRYAVVETSSEGLMQNRHWGIRYDVAVFTNLTPEHLEAHGGFERYKRDKGKLFQSLSKYPSKVLNGNPIPKAIVVNSDDANAPFFLGFEADSKYCYGLGEGHGMELASCSHMQATDIRYAITGTDFSVDQEQFHMQLVGKFNVYNALAALSVARHFGVSDTQIKKRLGAVAMVPGRMERIDAGQNFTVLVDYAHDEESFHNLFDTLTLFQKQRIIHVFGSAGGVRDHAKRPKLGAFSAAHADITIVTDEDSYDEPVGKILNEIAAGAAGKIEGSTLYKIENRREAIRKACELAQPGDLVLITGKGAEQSIKSNGTVTPWDDRTAAREILSSLTRH